MRKGKLTQAALARSVLRTLEKQREDVVQYPAYGCGYGAFRSGGQITVTAFGSSAGFPKTAPEFSVHEACVHLLAACAEPVGVTLQLLLPETYEEAELKKQMKLLDEAAGRYGAAVLGGHTEVTDRVTDPLVSVTAFGKADKLPPEAEPEQDLILAGSVASFAAAKLAEVRRTQLAGHFSESFLHDVEELGKERMLPAAVRILQKDGALPMKAAGRGGIFAALWEMAEHAHLGIDVELKRIPIRQETIEICEYFSLNPYQLFCSDTLLAAVPDGARAVRELAGQNIPAAVIGRTMAGKERILRNGEEIRYLDKPQTDEWYRTEEQE